MTKMRIKTYQTIQDMPPVMRGICECLTANEFRRGQHWDTEKIGLRFNITASTVQQHISKAMRATGTCSRRELAAWCNRGNGHFVRTPNEVDIPEITVQTLGGYGKRTMKRVHLAFDDTFHAMTLAHPLRLLNSVARWRGSAEGERRIEAARAALRASTAAVTVAAETKKDDKLKLKELKLENKKARQKRMVDKRAELFEKRMSEWRATVTPGTFAPPCPGPYPRYLPWIPGETTGEHHAREDQVYGPKPPRAPRPPAESTPA